MHNISIIICHCSPLPLCMYSQACFKTLPFCWRASCISARLASYYRHLCMHPVSRSSCFSTQFACMSKPKEWRHTKLWHTCGRTPRLAFLMSHVSHEYPHYFYAESYFVLSSLSRLMHIIEFLWLRRARMDNRSWINNNNNCHKTPKEPSTKFFLRPAIIEVSGYRIFNFEGALYCVSTCDNCSPYSMCYDCTQTLPNQHTPKQAYTHSQLQIHIQIRTYAHSIARPEYAAVSFTVSAWTVGCQQT